MISSFGASWNKLRIRVTICLPDHASFASRATACPASAVSPATGGTFIMRSNGTPRASLARRNRVAPSCESLSGNSFCPRLISSAASRKIARYPALPLASARSNASSRLILFLKILLRIIKASSSTFVYRALASSTKSNMKSQRASVRIISDNMSASQTLVSASVKTLCRIVSHSSRLAAETVPASTRAFHWATSSWNRARSELISVHD